MFVYYLNDSKIIINSGILFYINKMAKYFIEFI